ncbi:hypothetical protein GUJ93_ZPchr0001g29666 [Zizania palustris]|uniref:Uncharacterized protein n=1 Tax=Zizania palustris TaxID=103762 RepID=A0A8J5VSX3_ZIZPA|nr:hypothetical protein GUJ93_ZPchr0001g29666 [Zizania palustris]
MGDSGNANHRDHTIDIPRNDVNFPSTSHQYNHNNLDGLSQTRDPSNGVPHIPQSSSGADAASNSRNTSFARRDQGHRQPNPLNSGFWISIELIVNMSQIIAAIFVLSISRNEHPHAPLAQWLIGYTVGCIATLPHLYWRFLHRNRQNTDQESTNQVPSERDIYEPSSYVVVSSAHGTEVVDGANSTGVSRIASPRVYALVACFKLALDCFFAVWFVVGNVWVFGGRSSLHDAPNLYRSVMLTNIDISFLTSHLRCFAHLLVSDFQAVHSIPRIRLHWLCTAFHSLYNDMLLPTLHHLHDGHPRGFGSKQRCYRRSDQCLGGLQVQVAKDS